MGESRENNPASSRLPHGIRIARDGRLIVLDRENDRVQVFDQQGQVLGIWPAKLIEPAVICVDKDDIAYLVEHNAGLVSVLTRRSVRRARGFVGQAAAHGQARARLMTTKETAWRSS